MMSLRRYLDDGYVPERFVWTKGMKVARRAGRHDFPGGTAHFPQGGTYEIPSWRPAPLIETGNRILLDAGGVSDTSSGWWDPGGRLTSRTHLAALSCFTCVGSGEDRRVKATGYTGYSGAPFQLLSFDLDPMRRVMPYDPVRSPAVVTLTRSMYPGEMLMADVFPAKPEWFSRFRKEYFGGDFTGQIALYVAKPGDDAYKLM